METFGKAAPVSRSELALCLEAQAYEHKVATDNARFAKASPARKRVIIARDVLKWLAVGKIHAESGVYLSGQSPTLNADGTRDSLIKDDSRVDGGECRACALGAIFACQVERTGGLARFWHHNGQNMMHEHLKPYFDTLQLEQIESAFERSGFVSEWTVARRDNPGFDDQTYEVRQKMREVARPIAEKLSAAAMDWMNDTCEAAGLDKGDDRTRMECIMRNIIANKGTFVV